VTKQAAWNERRLRLCVHGALAEGAERQLVLKDGKLLG
jgi:hypothetical protein